MAHHAPALAACDAPSPRCGALRRHRCGFVIRQSPEGEIGERAREEQQDDGDPKPSIVASYALAFAKITPRGYLNAYLHGDIEQDDGKPEDGG